MPRKHESRKLQPGAKEKFTRHATCQRCHRLKELCFCDKVPKIPTRLRIVILQHPQEQYKRLNSAYLVREMLAHCRLKVGLSWPSFKAVAGPEELPSQWGILYLGPKKEMEGLCTIVDRHDKPVTDTTGIRGIIAIDGTWKQAKALWWRNPWFTRLLKVSLNPRELSMRSQVREEGLSTIEAVAYALECFGEPLTTAHSLREHYQSLILSHSACEPPESTERPNLKKTSFDFT